MPDLQLVEQYVAHLLAGNRPASRNLVAEQIRMLDDPEGLYFDLLWPAMERIEKLYRGHRINAAAEHMATRINRNMADQLQTHLLQQEANGQRMVICCADGEPEELGAQMCADLFESRGWETFFLGGGVPNDEILTLVGQIRPAILLVFGTTPTGVPGVRRLIDLIREVDAHPTMNILVSGGVFNRAEGLWKEIHADLYARSAWEALAIAEEAEPRVPVVRSGGTPKKRRRRRKPPLLAGNEAS